MDRHNAELAKYMNHLDECSKKQQKIDSLSDDIREELLSTPEYSPLVYSNFVEAIDELGHCQLSDELEAAIKAQDAQKIGELMLKNAWKYWGRQAEESATEQAERMLS